MSNIIALPAASGGVSTFTFDGHAIHVVNIEGEPWFVARDVLDALLPHRRSADTYASVASLGAAEKRTLHKTETSGFAALFPGSVARCVVVSESGLYRLILRANSSPTATAFQNWVTREVLPSIRKSGAYVAGQETLAPDQQAELAAAVAELTALVRGMIAEKEARKVAVTTDFTTVREFLEGIGVSMKQGRHSALPFHRTGPSRLPARGHAPAPRWPSAPHPLCSPGLPRGAGGLAVGAGR